MLNLIILVSNTFFVYTVSVNTEYCFNLTLYDKDELSSLTSDNVCCYCMYIFFKSNFKRIKSLLLIVPLVVDISTNINTIKDTSLTCNIDDFNEGFIESIKWFFNGAELNYPSDQNIEITNKNKSLIFLPNISENNKGYYQCQAMLKQNSQIITSSRIFMQIVKEFETFDLKCNIESNQPGLDFSLKIYFNKGLLAIGLGKSLALNLGKALRSNEGMYLCSVEYLNQTVIAQAMVGLVVQCK